MENLKLMNKKETLSDKAYNYIKSMIDSGNLKSGDIITENSIGNLLDMSRTPVKRAFVKLEQENYLKSIDGVGTVVSGISLIDLSDIYEVRVEIEKLGLRTSINNITTEEIDNLIFRINKVIQDYETHNRIDTEFANKLDFDIHNMVIKNSNNRYINEIYEQILNSINRYRFQAYELTDTLYEVSNQHLEIVEYIKDKNLIEAQNSLEKHIRFSYNALIEALTKI